MQTKYNREDFQSELKNLNIHFFLTSSSFEERCFVIPVLCGDYIKKAYLFYNDNEVPEIIDNAKKLSLELKSGEIEKVALNSDDPVHNFFKIMKVFAVIVKDLRKPNLLIDITTFTHETLLILLKLIELNVNSLGNIYIAYVGADCYSVNESDDSQKWLSKGIKTIRTVLGYPGFTDPTQKNHLVVLFGFESERTKKIIEEYEFEYVSLGFGKVDSSIQSNHQAINYERHKKMLEEYPNAKEFCFSLVDPYEAQKDILNHLKQEEYKNLNTVIAPLNNKLSTVGASLASMENENIQIAYAKPLIYNTSGYSRPNNDIYFYQLKFSTDSRHVKS